MDIIAVVVILAYFGFAAYNGEAGNAANATWQYGIKGAGFMAGAAVIWGLWQVKNWREPVAIFTAIIVLGFLLNSYTNLGKELQQVMAVLPNLKGVWGNATAAATPASQQNIPGITPNSLQGYPTLANNMQYMSSLPASDQGLGAFATSLFSGYMPSGLPNYSTIEGLNNQAIGNIQGGAAGL